MIRMTASACARERKPSPSDNKILFVRLILVKHGGSSTWRGVEGGVALEHDGAGVTECGRP